VKWQAYEENIAAVFFEPEPKEAQALRDKVGPRHTVIEAGLSNVDRRRKLFLTWNPEVSSLHEPNFDLLINYGIHNPHFEVIGTQDVECVRYDTLFREGRVPAPDAIKIDTQGHEYEVLQGFGGLLDLCLAIELEAHFYPVYKGQKLLYQIIDLLSAYDFVLRRLDPIRHYNGDLVEADAVFTKPLRVIQPRSALDRLKHCLICDVWGLEQYQL
jgi:FkbM family methyltransferase